VARSNSGTIVAGLITAALAAVGFLAYQASAGAPAHRPAARPGASGSPAPGKSTKHGSPGEAKPRHPLPRDSGSGVRVVYSLGEKRVWLVGKNCRVVRTYPVSPSSVSPAPGAYAVTSRSARIPGSDGVTVEHVVRFAYADGVVIGFSTAVDGSTPDPDSGRKTGGIREKRVDGKAMWTFAEVGTKVVVVA
jgi:hypothetical protein